ncbi:hypothetical protein HanIR_Chr02g0068921 [Helianthus annuus]|nr:hypothetical protein HanIR_Chr02g0068921 [Helianthus annuus]
MTVEVMVAAEARRGHTKRHIETENRERDDGGRWTTAIEVVFRRPAGEDDDGERVVFFFSLIDSGYLI